jgi:hypothetical protein
MCVHPRTQIVSPMVFCVTAGLIAPGVGDASGSELCACAPLADTVSRTNTAAAPDHTASSGTSNRSATPIEHDTVAHAPDLPPEHGDEIPTIFAPL